MYNRRERYNDWLQIAAILAIAIGIFYPVFYTEYAYTDELVGLSQFGKTGSHSLLVYGRVLTEKLAEWLFGSISTVKQLTLIRLFSFGCLLLSIPTWFFILKKIIEREKLPPILVFFSTLYLVCTPPVGIYVGWAACFELFIANTAGLVAGYVFCAGLRWHNRRMHVSTRHSFAAVLLGLISLFTYQNGFGCFLLPFFLHLLASPKKWRQVFIGLGGYLFISAIYYLLFKYSVRASHLEMTDRTGLHINLLNKLIFLFTRPLNSAFHFSWIFNEKSLLGLAIYAVLFAGWIIADFVQKRDLSTSDKLQYFVMVFCFFGFIYLPSMVVKENYASNRTLLGLDMAVFFLAANTLFNVITDTNKRKYTFSFLAVFFVVTAWYNFNRQFLVPVKKEYDFVKKYVLDNYRRNTDTIYFLRPSEDFFERKYGITRSWDEFGVPSAFFPWTPEFLVRQIVFEKTGSRPAADKVVVTSSQQEGSGWKGVVVREEP